MNSIARVSAVFLLILGVGVCGGWEAKADRRGISTRQANSKKTGVGTKAGESEEGSGVNEGSGGLKVKPLVVFREVERGWRSGTPRPFERYLGKGKVRLDFAEGGSRGGLFTKSQAYYLIADYLRRTKTTDIGFLKITDSGNQTQKPYALFERTCRDRNGISRKEVIFVSLSSEDKAWVISELRVIPARR